MNNPNRPEKIVVINGKQLQFVYLNGHWWVALKPICDALDVNYDWQKKTIKEDTTLAQLVWKTTLVGADGKQREMLCLPEKYIYGWIFSLQSGSPILLQYKQKCYDVLYEYFHGSVNSRSQLLMELRNVDKLFAALDEKLMGNMDYVELEGLRGRKREITKQLKALDEDLINPQLNLFTDKPLLT